MHVVCVQIGKSTLEDQFTALLERDQQKKGRDVIFDELKKAIKEESMKKHEWDDKAENSLVRISVKNLWALRSLKMFISPLLEIDYIY